MSWYRAGVLWVFISALASSLNAQISAEDLLNAPHFPQAATFAVSPDNGLVAYTVERSVVEANEGGGAKSVSRKTVTDLWMADLHSGQAKAICCGNTSAMFPSWSPDGKHLAFYRSNVPFNAAGGTPAWEAFLREAELVIWDRGTGTTKVFLKGVLGAASLGVQPLWRKDNNSLLVFTRPAGNATAPTHGPESPAVPAASAGEPLDRTILILSTSADHVAEAGKPASEDLHCVWSDAAIFNVAAERLEPVRKHTCPLYHAISPDNKWFVYAEPIGHVPTSLFRKHQIRTVDLDTLKDAVIFPECEMYSGKASPFAWSADGRFIAFTDQRSDPKTRALSESVIVVDVVDHTSQKIGAAPSGSWFGPRTMIWGPNGASLSFIRNNRLQTLSVKTDKALSDISLPNKVLISIVPAISAHALKDVGDSYSMVLKTKDRETENVGFWKVWPISGKSEMLLEENKGFSYGDYSELLSDGSGVLFVWESADQPAELYASHGNFKSVKRITNLGSRFDRNSLGHSRLVTWLNNDGEVLRGSLLLPSEYQPGRRYPMVVDVYCLADIGSNALNRFGVGDLANWQLLATRGYAVFRPDIPTMPKTKMSDVAKSVVPGVQTLIAMGIADPQRIGVIGHSDGGYAVLSLLIQSKIFAAAVMLSGAGNLIELYSYDYGQVVIEESFGFKSTPWENRQLFLDNSPYFYLDRVETPLLIVAGSQDTAVPPHLSMAVFKGLKRLGKNAVYVEYQGEEHSPLYYTYEHQLDLFGRITAWFDKYLKPAKPPN